MKKTILISMVAVLISGATFANQTLNSVDGSRKREVTTTTTPQVEGKVLEVVDGVKQPVSFVTVYCEGTAISTYTDENGNFVLPLTKAGKYTVCFSHAGYKIIQKEVVIKKNTDLDCDLLKDEILISQL